MHCRQSTESQNPRVEVHWTALNTGTFRGHNPRNFAGENFVTFRGGAFAQHAHSANYYVAYAGNTSESHPPTEACTINLNQHGVQNSGPWDPWLASDKKKMPVVPAGAVGGRIQDPGTRGYRWSKTADFSHGARTVHGAPP